MGGSRAPAVVGCRSFPWLAAGFVRLGGGAGGGRLGSRHGTAVN